MDIDSSSLCCGRHKLAVAYFYLCAASRRPSHKMILTRSIGRVAHKTQRTEQRVASPRLCAVRTTVEGSIARATATHAQKQSVVVPLAVQVQRRRSVACQAATALDRVAEPHLQLATAKLPPGADAAVFAQNMYQWAATLTQNGANLPFVSPLKADKLPGGFQISMLKRSDKTKSFGSAGDIVATVEQQDGVGAVLMVRFYEGAVAQDNKAAGWVPPSDPMQRLELVIDSCKDVDTIMANMPQAIRIAAKASMGA